MKLTPAQVKNLMRRGLRLLVDPEPTSDGMQRVRDYFDGRCSYCGVLVAPGDGDMDHLISAAKGGANALANRVLSCKPCNAQQKRDRDWIEFLRDIAPDPGEFQARRQRIEDWVAANGGHPKLDPVLFAALEEENQRITDEYDRACTRMKQLERGSRRT